MNLLYAISYEISPRLRLRAILGKKTSFVPFTSWTLTPPLPRGKLLSAVEGPAVMELKVRKSQEIYIIDVQGELDLYNAYKLKELLTKMFEKKIERFIINLDEVEYIDSSGIGVLIYISSTVKKSNLKLAITNVHGPVQKVMELTKLTDYFPITATLDDAMKAVGA
jgi:anti-sigma B factor antagonist